MARVIDASYATLIGTPEQIRDLLTLYLGESAILDLSFANIVLLEEPPTREQIAVAIATTPNRPPLLPTG